MRTWTPRQKQFKIYVIFWLVYPLDFELLKTFNHIFYFCRRFQVPFPIVSHSRGEQFISNRKNKILFFIAHNIHRTYGFLSDQCFLSPGNTHPCNAQHSLGEENWSKKIHHCFPLYSNLKCSLRPVVILWRAWQLRPRSSQYALLNSTSQGNPKRQMLRILRMA